MSRDFRNYGKKEEFNFALFQYSPFVTIIVDVDGRVIKSNAAKRMSGDRTAQQNCDVTHKQTMQVIMASTCTASFWPAWRAGA